MARFAVVYGSTRQGRQGIKAARFLVRQLQARGHEVDLIDPLEHPLPFLDRMHKEFDGDAPPAMQHIHDVFSAADGLVVVSAEYNHSVPPALKNILDHYQAEYQGKAAGIATYSAGPFAGVRVAVHLRTILGELGLYTCSIMFGVSRIDDAFSEDGEDGTENKGWERRAKRFLGELEWLTEATQAQRAKRPPY
jgi:NAD(P)H-dependent FMN reductase